MMAFGYALAASDSVRFRCLILFFIFVKAVATLFLLFYFVFIDGILTILISGIGDGVFCVILYLSSISYDKHLKKKTGIFVNLPLRWPTEPVCRKSATR